MEGLDLGQTSNPSLAWKMDVLKINDDDDDGVRELLMVSVVGMSCLLN